MREVLARQQFLGPSSDEALHQLRVAVVGVGGGGSHVALQLAHIGVGQCVLIDPDAVEEANLNRMIGATAADVTRRAAKVQVLARRMRRVNASMRIETYQDRWQNETRVLRDCDVIFGCIDTFAARADLERAARRYLTPYIDIGMDVHSGRSGYYITGQVALSMPGEACMRCMAILSDERVAQEAAAYGHAGARPQVIWPNGVLASTAVGLMVQLVTPWASGEAQPFLLEYDGNSHELRCSSAQDHLRNAHCPHFESPDDFGDPWYAAGR